MMQVLDVNEGGWFGWKDEVGHLGPEEDSTRKDLGRAGVGWKYVRSKAGTSRNVHALIDSPRLTCRFGLFRHH